MTTPTSRDYVIFEINFYTKNECQKQDFYYYFRMESYCKYYYRLLSS